MATSPHPAAVTPGTELPRYWPALDGLRGAAVLAVLLFHGGFTWAQGGFLGVSLFFTLSGFLITSLLLTERDRSGRISLGSFWARRARRLLPASLLALGFALVVTMTTIPIDQRVSALGDIRAALFHVSNWWFISEGASYADLGLSPSPVQHYWSLAIEEQFYLVFPVVAAVALRRSRALLGVLLLAVTIWSVATQVRLGGVDRIYFGTDTRAAELAVGGLLAVLHQPIQRLLGGARSILRRLVDVAGLGAIVVVAGLWMTVSQQNPGLYVGGFLMVALVSAGLLLAAVEGRRTAAVLAWRPMVALGKISYGVYLFHFPVFLALSGDRVPLGTGPLFVVRAAVTLALAVTSYHLLELPIRRGTVATGRQLLTATAAAVAAVLVVSAVAVVHTDLRMDDVQPVAADGLVIVPSQPVATSPPATSAPPETVGAPEPDPGVPPPTDGRAGPAGPAGPVEPLAPRSPRVVVVGDSTAAANGAGLSDWGARTGRLEVATVSGPGCSTYTGTRFRVREGYTFTPKGCDRLFAAAADEAQRIGADAIVVFIGSSQLADWEFPGLEGWRHVGEPAVDTEYAERLRTAAATLSAAEVPVLWADVPRPEWDLDEFGGLLGNAVPGSGPVSLNDPVRWARLEELDEAGLRSLPPVARWPYAAVVAELEASQEVRPDGLHVSPEGMGALADGGVFDAMGAAYRAVLAGGSVAPRTGAPVTWSVSSPG
ncbi:MAG: acyltransferase family protein [Acidimicrobiales bacterium]